MGSFYYFELNVKDIVSECEVQQAVLTKPTKSHNFESEEV